MYGSCLFIFFFFFQAEDGIRDGTVTGVQTCALPIYIWQSNAYDLPAIDRCQLCLCVIRGSVFRYVSRLEGVGVERHRRVAVRIDPDPNRAANRFQRSIMSMKVIIGAVVVVLAVVVLALTRTSSPEPQRGGGGSRPADRGAAMRLPVDGIVLQPQVLDNKVYSTGNIMAAEEVELRSEVSGKITQISFREGSHVAKGDLLVKINDSELRAQCSGRRL